MCPSIIAAHVHHPPVLFTPRQALCPLATVLVWCQRREAHRTNSRQRLSTGLAARRVNTYAVFINTYASDGKTVTQADAMAIPAAHRRAPAPAAVALRG